MIVDWLLRLLGDNPEQYNSTGKWPAFLADLTDIALIPLVAIFLFCLPFLIAKKMRKKFTPAVLVVCLIASIILLYLGNLLNDWSLGYGLGVIHGGL